MMSTYEHRVEHVIIISTEAADDIISLSCGTDNGAMCIGAYLANTGTDFHLVNTETSKIVSAFTGYAHPGNVVTSPKDPTIAVTSVQSNIVIYDVLTGKMMHVLDHQIEIIDAIVFSMAGDLLISNSQHYIRVWDISKGVFKAMIERPHVDGGRKTSHIAISADGLVLASTSETSAVSYWLMPYCTEEFKMTLSTIVTIIRFSPVSDSKRLACGCVGGILVIKDMSHTPVLPLQLVGNIYDISELAFSPDGRMLASGAWDSIHIWNAESGVHLNMFTLTRTMKEIAFHPSGGQLVAHTGRNCYMWTICEWTDRTNYLFGYKLREVVYYLMCVKTHFDIHGSPEIPLLPIQLWLDICQSIAQFPSIDIKNIVKH